MELQKAQTEYVMTTLNYANDVGLDAAYKYHQACLKASAHSPCLYDPVQQGGRYLTAYVDHIQPLIKSSSYVRKKQAYKNGSAASATVSSKVGKCRLHPKLPHTNEECKKQRQQPGTTTATTSGA